MKVKAEGFFFFNHPYPLLPACETGTDVADLLVRVDLLAAVDTVRDEVRVAARLLRPQDLGSRKYGGERG